MSGKENVPKEGTKNWQDEEALKRYRLIAPLLDPEMDEGKRRQLREETAWKEGVSLRSLYRYEKKYREEGFGGLRPAGRKKSRDQRLPENFSDIMAEAVQLKREVPKRSVRQIIKILELEGWAAPGELKQSTMQRHLYDAGLGEKQMKRYAEKRERSSRRFCRPHRMELLQGDINSAYPLAAMEFAKIFGSAFTFKITQVIGLTNVDAVSTQYRPFKQMIERLNRTYKASYRHTNGFDGINGACYDLAFWVAYYNFLRPHKHKKYKALNEVEMLQGADNMPGKWQLLIFLGQQTILNMQKNNAAQMERGCCQ